MDSSYADRYKHLYRGHWWFRVRRRLLLDELRRLWLENRFILDVGCGDGLFLEDLDEFGQVEGVEIDADLVDQDGPNAERIHVRPFDDNFRPGRQYDVILFLDTLEHLEDPVGALSHARWLLAPGGVVVVTVPAFEFLWTSHDDLNHHHLRYTRSVLEDQARKSRLRITRSYYFFHWLFLAKIAVRAKEAVIGSVPRPPEIPAPWANLLLDAASSLERRCMGWLKLPFGSSLFAVLEAD